MTVPIPEVPPAPEPAPATKPASVPVDAPAVVVGPNGYPLDTKPADMSDGHRAAYWQHRSHQNETADKAKAKRIAELEPLEAEKQAAVEAARTDAERAAIKAREDGEKAGRDAADAAALDKFAPRLVGAEFRAQLAGRMTAEQIATLVGGLNVRGFLTDEGEPDAEKVAAFVAAIPATAGSPAPQPVRDFGGGRRDSVKVDGLQRGEDLYASRHKKKSSA